MDTFYKHKKLIIYSCLCLAAVIFIPIKVGYSVDAPGKIVAAREWVVARGTDGRLLSTVLDHKRGMHENYSVAQFERGDAVQFSLKRHIASGVAVAAGDTVGSIYSNDFEREYVELKGLLTEARANLDYLRTGEKQAVVEEARRNLELARKQAEEQEKVFQRVRGLHERNLISKEEFEITAGERELNEIRVMIAQAQLQRVQSGAKSEEVELIKARIEALEQQLQTLRKRAEQFTLVSPVSGIAQQVFSGDTILVLQDTTELILKMPIPWRQRRYVAAGQAVKLSAPDVNGEPAGSLLKIDQSVHNLGGVPVLFATASIDAYHPDLAPGLMLECSIACEPVKPRQYVARILKAMWR